MRALSAAVMGLALAAAVPWAALATATLPLYSNMNIGRTSIVSDAANTSQWLAYRFVPTNGGTANLLSVEAQCTTSDGTHCQAGNATMSIYSDSSGQPGTLLATSDQFAPPVYAPAAGNCLVLPSPPTLTSGTAYWAVMKGTSTNYVNWLFQDDSISAGTYISTNSGSSWQPEISSLRKQFTLRVDQGAACGGDLVSNPVDGTTIGNLFPRSGHQDVNTIELSNDGISDLHLTGYSISGGTNPGVFSLLDASVKDSPLPPNVWPQHYTLLSNASVIMYLTCTGPLAEGHFTSTLTFTTDDPAHPSISWPLSCYVDNTPPVISFSPNPDGSNGWFKSLPASVGVLGDDGVNGSGTNMIACSVNGTPFLNENDSSAATMLITEPPAVEGNGNVISCIAGDVAGNVTPTPTTTSISIDTRAPVISAGVLPAPNGSGWNNTDVTVSFACADPTPGSGLATNTVAGGTFTAETPPAGTVVTNTGDCIDVAGNAAAPSSVTIKIDKTPPSTQIVSAPASRTNSSNAAFQFGGSDAGSGIASFQCSLDSTAATSCSSPQSYSGLADGSHTLTASAVDAAGNVDPVGASASWYVDSSAPTVVFDSPPDASVTQGSGSIAFHAADVDDSSGFSFTCQLDGGTAASCTSPYPYSFSSSGNHQLSVTASDPAGNVSAPTTLHFGVDTTTGTIIGNSVNPSVLGQSVTFTATVSPLTPGSGTPTGTVIFSIDGASQTAVALSGGVATLTTNALSVGPHTIGASYNGDSMFSGSTAGSIGQAVDQATTQTAVSSSANPSIFLKSVTFTATVSASAPGGGIPDGSIQWYIDGTTASGPVSLDGSGQAKLTTSSLSSGSHTILASYSGSTNYADSVASVGQSVTNPGPAQTFVVFGIANSYVAGAAHNVTVATKDASGNTATGYRGTVHFTSTDPAAVLPANYTFTAADGGIHRFSLALNSAGSQGVRARDTTASSITGAKYGILVTGYPAATLTLSGSPIAGVAHDFTVTAKDANGNTDAGYRGTVHFTSTDPKAILPPDYTFTAADAGVHTFSVTFKTAGTQGVRARDTVTSTMTGAKYGIVVN